MAGWKTFLFNAALALVGVIEVTNWADMVGSDTAGYVLIAAGLAGKVLRALTTTPIFKSE